MVDKRVIDTIIAEAVGGGEQGMLAVANVIHNRAIKKGKTPFQIVSAPSQFEGYSNPGPGVSGALKDSAVRAKVEALWNGVVSGTLPDPTNGGTMFHSKSITPYWATAENRHGAENIGGNIFYLGNKPHAVSPVVPPPPNRSRGPITASASALGAINATMGLPSVSAPAYAPPGGSLVAPPIPRAAVPLPPPRNTAVAPSVPTVRPIPPFTALPLPSPTAKPTMAPLPAVSPLIPTIRARELPLSAANFDPPPAPAQMLPGLPQLQQAQQQLSKQSEMAQLAATLGEYGKTYQPVPRGVQPPTLRPSPPPRSVSTVPIDPATGGIPKPNMAAVAEREAERLRLAALSSPAVMAQTPRLTADGLSKVPVPETYRLWDEGAPVDAMRSAAARGLGALVQDGPASDPLAGVPPGTMAKVASLQRTTTSSPALKASMDALAAKAKSEPKTAVAPYTGPMPDNGYSIPPAVAAPPTKGKSPSLLELMGKTPATSRPPPTTKTAYVPPPGKLYDPSFPFGYPPAADTTRLQPQPPGYGNAPPVRVSAAAGITPPQVPLPRPRPATPSMIMAAPTVPTPPGTGLFPPPKGTPVKDTIAQVNGPGAQVLDWINQQYLQGRRRPLIRAAFGLPQAPGGLFGKPSTSVATSTSTRPMGLLGRIGANMAEQRQDRYLAQGDKRVEAIAKNAWTNAWGHVPSVPTGNPSITASNGKTYYYNADEGPTEIQKSLIAHSKPTSAKTSTSSKKK